MMIKLDVDFWWNYIQKMVKDSDMGKRYIKQKAEGENMSEIDGAIVQGCAMGMIIVGFQYLSQDLAKEVIQKKTSWYVS